MQSKFSKLDWKIQHGFHAAVQIVIKLCKDGTSMQRKSTSNNLKESIYDQQFTSMESMADAHPRFLVDLLVAHLGDLRQNNRAGSVCGRVKI